MCRSLSGRKAGKESLSSLSVGQVFSACPTGSRTLLLCPLPDRERSDSLPCP